MEAQLEQKNEPRNPDPPIPKPTPKAMDVAAEQAQVKVDEMRDQNKTLVASMELTRKEAARSAKTFKALGRWMSMTVDSRIKEIEGKELFKRCLAVACTSSPLPPSLSPPPPISLPPSPSLSILTLSLFP